nr:MAG TPA: hypothetical protein [Caudoviricetes sp.]
MRRDHRRQRHQGASGSVSSHIEGPVPTASMRMAQGLFVVHRPLDWIALFMG